MSPLLRIAAALLLVVSAAAAHAAEIGPTPTESSVREAASSIPPNCVMDPWTHKYVCFKWPKKKKAALIG